MTLTYADGSTTEALVLAQTENRMRVAIPGADDAIELTNVRGTWISEDCEPVRVQFAWEGRKRPQAPAEADCVCAPDLAAHLIGLLSAKE